jgi:hypothetical protein
MDSFVCYRNSHKYLPQYFILFLTTSYYSRTVQLLILWPSCVKHQQFWYRINLAFSYTSHNSRVSCQSPWFSFHLKLEGSSPLEVLFHHNSLIGAAIAQWCNTGLWAGWPGVRFPAGAGNVSLQHRVQTGSGVHPAPYSIGTRCSFLGVKRPGHEATTELHLVPRSRLHGAIPQFLQYVFMAWCSVKAQGQLYLCHLS